jgi:hypothetical protein
MKTKTSDRRKRMNRKFQLAGVFFGLAGLGLIAVSSINYLLIFIGIGLIAAGVYFFVDNPSFAAK